MMKTFIKEFEAAGILDDTVFVLVADHFPYDLEDSELAELYGDMNQMAKANGWVAKMYQIQGGDAFNNKDYATAAGIFEKGYKADPDNTDMALNLAMSYCEMFMNTGDMALYERGMEIYEAVAAKTHPKYAEAAAKAKEMITLYTNNMVVPQTQTASTPASIWASIRRPKAS